MAKLEQFTRVEFRRLKAFRDFDVRLNHFNILVGPNNAGKSTIIAAFRILASAMRRANRRKPEFVTGPHGITRGYSVDLKNIPIAAENIFFNYDTSEPASVVFTLSNKNKLTLFFPEADVCYLTPDPTGTPVQTTSMFRSQFNCPIGFVPILGPVEHNEPFFQKEAARLALFSHRSARNFRNIWYHYPDRFDQFRETLRETWPGMDINKPDVDYSQSPPVLHMFCPEKRIPREIYWSGFGFQVWCQMLTHIIQQGDQSSIFLIDEPDIYLHSDLQRQLLALLRDLGPDIILATHSMEIISDAEPGDIVVVNKNRRRPQRIKNSDQLSTLSQSLGSNLNPILTQLEKTRRALFVEGSDFNIISRFANKPGVAEVVHRRNFAVIPVGGFNPERIRSLKSGIELTLGGNIKAAALFDRDYRCLEEITQITKDCLNFCEICRFQGRKEIENYLIVPEAIERAIKSRMHDREVRMGQSERFDGNIDDLIGELLSEQNEYAAAQTVDSYTNFKRKLGTGDHQAVLTEQSLRVFGESWGDIDGRIRVVPGKELLTQLNKRLQKKYGISITATLIIKAMSAREVPADIKDLVNQISTFAS